MKKIIVLVILVVLLWVWKGDYILKTLHLADFVEKYTPLEIDKDRHWEETWRSYLEK